IWESLSEPSILVARELSPGLTVQLDRSEVVGLISEEGTRTSHAAILAHSLGIPAIFGLRGAVARIPAGTKVILDGTRGTVLLDPTPAEVEEAERTDTRRRELAARLEEAVAQPSVTLDGVHIALRGNVDLPDEVEAAKAHGAEGVGLLRTEFLITGHSGLPRGGDDQPPAHDPLGHATRRSRAHAGDDARRSRSPRERGNSHRQIGAARRDGRDAGGRGSRRSAGRNQRLPQRRHQ